MLVRIYPLILLLQAYCLYHAYKHNQEQKWFWLIIFLPLFGSLIYLYIHYMTRDNMVQAEEGLKQTFIPNYKTQQLEKALQLSDTFNNRMNLADAYLEDGRYEEALELYRTCSSGFDENDPVILMKTLRANYFLENYHAVIELGEKLQDEKLFQNSEERTGLSVAYSRIGDLEKAEAEFKTMDHRFSNYNHRLEYAKFLMEIGKFKACKGLLYVLEEEFSLMDSTSKKQNKPFIHRSKYLARQLQGKGDS